MMTTYQRFITAAGLSQTQVQQRSHRDDDDDDDNDDDVVLL